MPILYKDSRLPLLESKIIICNSCMTKIIIINVIFDKDIV